MTSTRDTLELKRVPRLVITAQEMSELWVGEEIQSTDSLNSSSVKCRSFLYSSNDVTDNKPIYILATLFSSLNKAIASICRKTCHIILFSGHPFDRPKSWAFIQRILISADT